MTVEQAIEQLKKQPPDAELGTWRYSAGAMKFQPIDDFVAEAINAQVFVGISTGKYTATVDLKNWPKP